MAEDQDASGKRKLLTCAQFREKAPFRHGAALLVVAVPAAGKSYFAARAKIAGKGVPVADGDEIVAARRGWPRKWRLSEKSRAKQYRAMYEAYVEHALEYPLIPVIGSAAKGGLPTLAAYYDAIVFRAVTATELLVRAMNRMARAASGEELEHKSWATMTPEQALARTREALASQEWYARQVDYVFTSWRALADKCGLRLPSSYSEDIPEEQIIMAERMFGTLNIGGKEYKVSGDAEAVEKARLLLSAAPTKPEQTPAAASKEPVPEPAPEPRAGDVKQFAPRNRGALPDPDRWMDVKTPSEARR